MASVVEFLLRTYSRPRRLRGAAALRILIGFGTLMLLIGNYSNRTLLWGSDSIVVFRRLSLLGISEEPIVFEMVFHAFILGVLAFTVFGGRFSSISFTVIVISLHNRNIAILDGGDNLVQLIALVMPFLITSAYWSPLAPRTQRHLKSQENAPASMTFAIHNAAIAIVLFQTAVVYVTAGLWKASSDVWRHGIALDIVASSARYGLAGQLRWAMSNPVLLTMSTYSTIGVQLAFVPLLMTRKSSLRILAVSLVALMHVGIMITVGLVGFGINMIGADSAFLTDDDYEVKLPKLFGSMRRLFGAGKSPDSLGPVG